MAAILRRARYERMPMQRAPAADTGHAGCRPPSARQTIAPEVRDTLSHGVCLGRCERPRTGST